MEPAHTSLHMDPLLVASEDAILPLFVGDGMVILENLFIEGSWQGGCEHIDCEVPIYFLASGTHKLFKFGDVRINISCPLQSFL